MDNQEPKHLFNHEDIYDSVITPKILELRELCSQHKIPLFTMAVYSAEDSGNGVGCFTHFPENITPTVMKLFAAMAKNPEILYKFMEAISLSIPTELVTAEPAVRPS